MTVNLKKHPCLLGLCLVLVCLGASARTTQSVYRSFDIPSPATVEYDAPDGETYSVINGAGMFSGETPGAPALPFERFQVRVPAGATNFSVSAVTPLDSVSVRLPHRLVPCQEPVPTRDAGVLPDFTVPDVEAYLSSVPTVAVMDDGYIAGDIHVVTVGIIPACYSDAERSLSLYSEMEFQLSYDLGPSTAKAAAQGDTGRNGLYRLLDSLSGAEGDSPLRALSQSVADADPTHYYIITPASLKESVGKLARWKEQKGYTVHVQTVEDILGAAKYRIGQSTYISGRTETIVDSAASLRAWLHDEFTKYGPYYCLLVGDYRTSMPIRKTISHRYDEASCKQNPYYRNSNGEIYIPTDNYFADFSTKWDLKTEMDESCYTVLSYQVPYYPDIILSRLLCAYPWEVMNFTDKLLIYESNPGLGDDDYLQTALYFEQDKLPNSLACSLLGNSKIVIDKFNPFGENNTLVIHDNCNFPITYPYHGHAGCDIIQEMSQRGFISAHGHGSPVSIQTCMYYRYIVPNSLADPEEMYVKPSSRDSFFGINDMTNYYKPSVMYSIACDSAPFDAYTVPVETTGSNGEKIESNGHVFNQPHNMASAFTNYNNIGGIAYIGNTRVGYRESSAEAEADFGEYLLDCPKPGIAVAMTKPKSQSSHVRVTNHLIGEPEFEMWLGKPLRFTPTVSTNGSKFTFKTDMKVTATVDCFGTKTVVKSDAGSMPTYNGDYVASLWCSGYLPFIRYYAQSGELRSIHDAYTLDAQLGGLDSNTFVIKSGGALNLNCFNLIQASSGFVIESGGVANLSTMQKCSLENMTVQDRASLNISAKETVLQPGFVTELGASVKIGN